jgi:MoaA/NifB/PqqE/SkfB family radical SAM enzyme
MVRPEWAREAFVVTRIDYSRAPGVVLWETTQGYDLTCRPCRSGAWRTRHPNELSTAEGVRLLNEIRRFGYPLVVFTGCDPLERPDMARLVEHGERLRLPLAVAPSGPAVATVEFLRKLRAAGLSRLPVSPGAPSFGAQGYPRQGAMGGGVLLIGHTGEVYLTSRRSVSVGNVRRDYIVDLYRARSAWRGREESTGGRGSRPERSLALVGA